MKGRYSNAYNRKHGVRSLFGLKPGQTVRVKHDGQNQWNPVGVVSRYGSTLKSYIVGTSDGKTLQRNRRHLQAISEADAENNSVPETKKLTGRAIDQGNPQVSVQNTPNRTSSGRVIQKPKRYIEEC